MGVCVKCKELIPPDLMLQKEDASICAFCEFDQSTVFLHGEKITKEFAIRDYKIFLDDLYAKRNIQDIMHVENVVARMKKRGETNNQS